MATLDGAAALTPGCDLWIITDAVHSRWSRRIDWYLNFQIRRASAHLEPDLSVEMRQVIDECEVAVPDLAIRPGAPLMVASSELVHASKTVLVPAAQDVESWVKSCHLVWKNLGMPKTRVFLPEGLSAPVFMKTWSKADSSGLEFGLELVAESTFSEL